MSSAQILAYAAPIVLAAVGGLMLWTTKARLARRQRLREQASVRETAEAKKLSLDVEATDELVFVTEVEPGTFKSQSERNGSFTGLVMRIDPDALRQQVNRSDLLASAAAKLSRTTTP